MLRLAPVWVVVTLLTRCSQPGHLDRAAPSASAALPAASQIPDSPVKHLSDEDLGAAGARPLCRELCAAAMRCRAKVLFGGGPRAVGHRLEVCREGCGQTRFARPHDYNEGARRCLRAADCDAYATCARELLPPAVEAWLP